MREKFDVVVVGGGPGGLATAALLAKAGSRTLVLEREQRVGGRYRAVDFAGCRSDCAVHILTAMGHSLDETYGHRLFAALGRDLRQDEVDWVMCLVGREAKAEWFAMDLSKGIHNFFDFFAFGAGMPLGEAERAGLEKAFNAMGDLTREDCRKEVGKTFAKWLAENVENDIVRTIIEMCCPLMGAPAADVNLGQMANIFGTFPRIGAMRFWYPADGMLEDAIIRPLVGIIEENGGEVRTGWTAEKLLVEGDCVRGLWARENDAAVSWEIEAPAVVAAFPIFFAVGEGRLVSPDLLSDTLRESISLCSRMRQQDLTGFFLLDKQAVPIDVPGWFHVFDSAEGIPTYVGDCIRGDFCHAEVPEGKQLLYSYIPGTLDATPFGYHPSEEVVSLATRRWKDGMEKAFPGFEKTIEREAWNLQLNWGRYAWAVVPEEIGVRCPTVRGLYFAGDSVLAVSSLASEKVFEVAMECADAIATDRAGG